MPCLLEETCEHRVMKTFDIDRVAEYQVFRFYNATTTTQLQNYTNQHTGVVVQKRDYLWHLSGHKQPLSWAIMLPIETSSRNKTLVI